MSILVDVIHFIYDMHVFSGSLVFCEGCGSNFMVNKHQQPQTAKGLNAVFALLYNDARINISRCLYVSLSLAFPSLRPDLIYR